VLLIFGGEMAEVGNEQTWMEMEIQARKLFSPSAPINEADLFSGRLEQISRIVNGVAERGRHAVLYGERGVGKTSLGNIFHKLTGSIGIMPIRQQVSPEDNYTSLWKKVFRELVFEVKENVGYGNESTKQHSVAEFYDNITPDDVVRELRRTNFSNTPVIILDEFDKIKDVKTKQLMAHTIKALSDSGVDVTVLIIGVADDITTLVEEHQSVSRNIEEIKMPRMNKGELNAILDQRLPKLGIKIEGDARWKIVTLSRGLPEYIHSLGRDSAIRAIKEKKKVITEAHVGSAISELISQSDQSINNAYKKAVHSNKKNALYKEVLLACAMAQTDDEGKFAPADVVEPLTKILQGRKVTIANFQSHLTAFSGEDRGNILKKHGIPRGYKYRFTEPKMQPYVIMQGINAELIGNEALAILSAPEQPSLPNIA